MLNLSFARTFPHNLLCTSLMAALGCLCTMCDAQPLILGLFCASLVAAKSSVCLSTIYSIPISTMPWTNSIYSAKGEASFNAASIPHIPVFFFGSGGAWNWHNPCLSPHPPLITLLTHLKVIPLYCQLWLHLSPLFIISEWCSSQTASLVHSIGLLLHWLKRFWMLHVGYVPFSNNANSAPVAREMILDAAFCVTTESSQGCRCHLIVYTVADGWAISRQKWS